MGIKLYYENYPQNAIFLNHNRKLHKMIDMHVKYDNMHTNRTFNTLICINNHVNCMLLPIHMKNAWKKRQKEDVEEIEERVGPIFT